jgi:hypothetical protein
MKKVLCTLAAFTLLAGVILVQCRRLEVLREENRSLSRNVETLAWGINRYKTRDSLHAAGVGRLELKLSEYREFRRQDARTIESLRIRLKRVEETSLHATESRYQFTAPVRDTLFPLHEPPETIRRFAYHSNHVDLLGELKKDSVALTLTTRDTLLQVVHRIPRRFLFIRYGTRAIRQEVVSKNPHTRITYTECIELIE